MIAYAYVLLTLSFTQMPVKLSDDMYLNPIHQGWLTKEGKNNFLCHNNYYVQIITLLILP